MEQDTRRREFSERGWWRQARVVESEGDVMPWSLLSAPLSTVASCTCSQRRQQTWRSVCTSVEGWILSIMTVGCEERTEG